MNHFPPFQSVPVQPPLPAVPSAAVPLVLVVEGSPGLSSTIAELCDFLRIRVEALPDAGRLPQWLELQPIAVLVHAEPGHAADHVAQALETVARHDAGLPVLLVTDSRATLGGPPGETGAPRRLTNLHWMTSSPGIKPLVEFLFMAERRCGIPGLMPA